ncbi:hypothetical protein Tco_0829023, partial [Tanacetum coccineum]
QDKYVAEILKKSNYTNVKSASTPVDLEKPLVKDEDADDVDVHLYRSMIGSLIYLKGKPTLGLWYSRDSPFELVAYTDSDYAGATQDRKSPTGGYLLTKGFDAGRHVKRGRDTKIPQSGGPPVKVGDEAVHKELGDRMEKAATIASSLKAEQDSGKIQVALDRKWQESILKLMLQSWTYRRRKALSRKKTEWEGSQHMLSSIEFSSKMHTSYDWKGLNDCSAERLGQTQRSKTGDERWRESKIPIVVVGADEKERDTEDARAAKTLSIGKQQRLAREYYHRVWGLAVLNQLELKRKSRISYHTAHPDCECIGVLSYYSSQDCEQSGSIPSSQVTMDRVLLLSDRLLSVRDDLSQVMTTFTLSNLSPDHVETTYLASHPPLHTQTSSHASSVIMHSSENYENNINMVAPDKPSQRISLSGKTTGLDKLRLSRAQILWAMYYKKNVDYVELLWEDFTYQIDNKGHKKQDKMYYPRFTKVIIHHFLTKDMTVSKRNKIGMHTSRDDYLINTLRFVSAKEESQIYGARLSKSLTSPEMQDTKAYKTYLGYATGVTPPKKA